MLTDAPKRQINVAVAEIIKVIILTPKIKGIRISKRVYRFFPKKTLIHF